MKTRDRSHTCHAEGCETSCPPAMFMCRPHWFSLPKTMRNAVWAVYVPGQENRMDPSREYLEVAHNAIEWLANKEGRR